MRRLNVARRAGERDLRLAELIGPPDLALPPSVMAQISGLDVAPLLPSTDALRAMLAPLAEAAVSVAASAVESFLSAANAVQEVERRPSGILVPRRGPRRKTPTQWLAWAAEALAEHCQDTGDDPFDCDYGCLAMATNRAPITLVRAASQRGVRLARIQAEAWALQGCPDLSATRNFVHPDVWLRRSKGA